jgi:exodeoxyribonuclease VII small subunit
MKKELTYNEAFVKLEKLVERLEEGTIQLEKLSTIVKEATDLIAICEAKLRNTDKEVKDTIKSAAISRKRKSGK